MFIFPVGSHGTGKTTVLREISNRTGDLYLDGISRPVIRANLPIGKAEHQTLIDDLTIHIQKHFIDYDRLVYFTRNVFDCIAYAKVNIRNFSNEKKMIDFYHKIKDDSIFFYFPITFELEGDSERSGNPLYQQRVDSEIRKLLFEYDVPHFTVTGTIDERIDFILSKVSLMKLATLKED